MSKGRRTGPRVTVARVDEGVDGRVVVRVEVVPARGEAGAGPACEAVTAGARIALRRRELGLSQETLGVLAGVCQQDISRAERTGGALITLRTAARLARVLGVSLSWLAGDT